MESLLGLFSLTPRDAALIPVGTLLFLAFWKGVDTLLFRPFLSVTEARESATIGAEEAARIDRGKADALAASVETRMREARRAAYLAKEKRVTAAREEARAKVAAAEAAAAETVRRARAELEAKRRETEARLMTSVDPLASSLCDAVGAGPAGR